MALGHEGETEWFSNVAQRGKWATLKSQCSMATFDQEILGPTAEPRLTWLPFALLPSHCFVAATERLETCTDFLCSCVPHTHPTPPQKKRNPKPKSQKQISPELVRLHGTIGYGRVATKDLESTIRNNPCQAYLLQSPAEKWGETEGSRQSTTFIVGILLTSLDLNCSLEAKPTLMSFIPLKSQS